METDAPVKNRKRAWKIGCGLAFVIGAVLAVPIVDVIFDLRREGFLDETKQREYSATSMGNLKALYQATQLYYEANEAMPGAAVWMDDLSTFVRTNDLKKGEEMKKFVNPRLRPGGEVFGYAFNELLSGAWKEHIEDPANTPLVFESGDSRWNAHGEPGKLQPNPELAGGNKAVTADGAAVALKDLLQTAGR